MRQRAIAYTGLLLLLVLAKFLPKAEFLVPIYMLFPLLFLSDRELGFKDYGKGVLYGSPLLPLLLLLPPDLSCLAWVLNQLGIATAEEVFFRAYLMGSFGNLTVSFLFSLAHLVSFPTLNSLLVFFPSLAFGYVYVRSGSILAPILLHFSSNLLYHSFIEKFPQLNHLLQRQLTGG